MPQCSQGEFTDMVQNNHGDLSNSSVCSLGTQWIQTNNRASPGLVHALLIHSWDLRQLGTCSVQFSHSDMSDSLWSHEPQHARPPCPSPTPGVHPNPCPLSWWCHPTIWFSVVPFSSCPQSFPALGSFLMSQLFASSGQSIGFSFNISPSNEHPGPFSLRMDWLDLPAVQGTLKSLLQHHTSKASILLRSALFIVQLSHPYMSTGKTKFSIVLLIFCLLVFVSYWQKYVQFSK